MPVALHHKLFAGAVFVCALSGGGCAKEPTSVITLIEADAAVPPVLQLGVRIAPADDPARASTSRFSSSNLGDAADRPAPFVFPFARSLTVDASLAGPVVITLEALDWDTNAVTAAGSTNAEVIPQRETQATVRLAVPAIPY
jgi:hypothetical protein